MSNIELVKTLGESLFVLSCDWCQQLSWWRTEDVAVFTILTKPRTSSKALSS